VTDHFQDDTRIMSLVDLALAQPPDQREACLLAACAGDTELFSRACRYVKGEERMVGFLPPLYSVPRAREYRLLPDEVLEDSKPSAR
jgi:hypothetical protein